MSAPKVGDRVRVTIEGNLLALGLGGGVGQLGSEFVSTQVPLTAGAIPGGTVSVEVLAPEWQYGDVVSDSCDGDNIYIHNGDGWISPGGRESRFDGDCRLTLLVRDGKPVQS